MSTCPVCSAPTEIAPATRIYGISGKEWGNVLVCSRFPACDTFVGCHQGTTKPKGIPAGRLTRAARIGAHNAFDPLWSNGAMSRSAAYALLSRLTGIKDPHIGEFTIEQCNDVVTRIAEYLLSGGKIGDDFTKKEG